MGLRRKADAAESGNEAMKLIRIGILLFAATAGVLAQQGEPDSGSAPTLRVTTRLVFVDVVVRDSAGTVVSGLGEKDFHIFEDGKPESIEYFIPHGGVSPAAAAAPAPPADSVTSFTNTDAASAAPLTILLFDLMNTPTDDQLFARQQMMKFLSMLPTGEHVVLFCLSQGLSMSQGLSGNPVLLKAANEMLRVRDVGLDQSSTETLLDQQIASNAAVQGGGSAAVGMVNATPQEQAETYEVRARTTIDALGHVARIMANYPGRKSLYWVAESYPLSVDRIGVPVMAGVGGALANPGSSISAPNPALGVDKSIGEVESHFSQTSQQEMRRTLNLLANARVAVYPTSVIGLASQASPAAVMGGVVGLGINTPNPGDPRGGFFALNNLRSDMNDLARVTGGEAIFGTNDLAGTMLRKLNDGAVYYTLAYKPASEDWHGQFRGIKVETGEKYSLIYRRGYFATADASATDQPDDLMRAMQPEAAEETALHLRSRILPAVPEAAGVTFESTIDARDVDFSEAAHGHRRATLHVQLIGFTDGAKQPPTLPQTSGTLHIDLDPNRYRMILAEGIAFRQSLALKPGRYIVVLGVSDEASRRLGTLEMPVRIP